MLYVAIFTLTAAILVLLRFQAGYVFGSFRARDSLAALRFGKDALDPILRDVLERSKLGWPPDWAGYSDRFERLTELPLERIRQYANAALVTGIAGTIIVGLIALITNWDTLLNGDSEQDLPPEVLWHGVIALLSSFFGIYIHLWILRVLKAAQKLAEDKVEALSDEVREYSTNNPPSVLSGQLEIEIGNIFREVVGRLPEQLQSIDSSVKSLEQVIDNQLGTMVRISEELPRKLAELKSSADSLATTTSAMDSYSQSIAESTSLLKGLPEELASTLKDASNVWKTEIQAGNQSFVSAIRDTLAGQQKLLFEMEGRFRQQKAFMQESIERQLRLLQETVNQYGTLETLLQSLPERNGEVFVNAFEQFQAEVRDHVRNLGETIGIAIGDLLANQSELLIGLDTRLDRQGSTMQEALKNLTDRQNRLDEQYEELYTLINELPEKNREVIESMISAFGAEARRHVLGLKGELTRGLNNLLELLAISREEAFQDFVSRTAQIMDKVLEYLSKRIRETVIEPLTRMGNGLEQAAERLPSAADRFAKDLEAVSDALVPLPQQLGATVQDVATLTKTIQEDLTKSFADAATRALEPVSTRIDVLIEATEKDHKLISNNANDLVKLISGIIERRRRLMN